MSWKPVAGLTETLRSLLKTLILVTAVAVVADLYDVYSYATLHPDVDPSRTLLASDVVSGVVGLVQVVFFVVVLVAFLMWVHRVNGNLRLFSGEQLRFTPGWAVGWYFVPVACLFKPFQSMKELWRVSHGKAPAEAGIVGAWWGFWIVSVLFSNVVWRITSAAQTAQEQSTAAVLVAASDAVDVGLNVLTLVVVTKIGAAYSRNIVERLPREAVT